MATIAEMITRLRAKTHVPTGMISDAVLLSFFNEGLNDLSQRGDWEFLEGTANITTVASTQGYAVPTGAEHIQVIVEDGQQTPLQPVSAAYARRRYGDDFPSGSRGKAFFVWDEKVHLIPTPDQSSTVYHVFYTAYPTEFTATSDSPPFLRNYHHVLQYYVEARIWEEQEDFEKAMAAQGRYEFGVRQLKLAYEGRVSRRPWAVGDGGGRWRFTNTPYSDDWGDA